MGNLPKVLYHYTSIENLALILTNKTLCFNTLLNVDDIEEAETTDLDRFGKYVYVSCWTDEELESVAMWQMYTPNMHGVRIQLPVFPFQKHYYKAGELHFRKDTTSYIDLKKLYNENKASIVAELPKLLPITYTVDDELLHPRVREGASIEAYASVLNSEHTGGQSHNIHYDFSPLGRYKNDVWRFQKEWRYWISLMPMGLKELETATTSTHMELVKRLEDTALAPPYEHLFVELSDEAISQMEVIFGPRMTEAEKILTTHLLKANGLDGNWHDSVLRIR